MPTKKTTTLDDVLTFLATASLTVDDHRRIVAAVNARHKMRQRAAKANLSTGDKVTWTSKYGYPMTGTITEVRRTRAAVTATSGERWSVSVTLLKPVA